jgi:hypothetical protein
MQTTNLDKARAYVFEQGWLPVANDDAAFDYDRAVDAFAAGGTRSAAARQSG